MTRVQPTEFPELNDLLAELTDRAVTILGDNLVGVYLQGSFAVGDADLASDCDFLVPVHRQVTADQERALRGLHDEIPTRDGFWCRHLEGSYPVAEELRTLAGLGCPWLYHGEHLYGFSSAIMTAMHFDTGKVAWRDRSVGKGSLVFADDRLYVYSEGGVVGLVEPSPEGYREHGRFTIKTGSLPTWAHPVVSGGKLFVRDQDTIYAYNVALK